MRLGLWQKSRAGWPRLVVHHSRKQTSSWSRDSVLLPSIHTLWKWEARNQQLLSRDPNLLPSGNLHKEGHPCRGMSV